jgi:hypothetical protein
MVLGLQNYGTKIFTYFSFKPRFEKATKSPQMELMCIAILILTWSFLKQNCKISIPTYKQKVSCVEILWITNDFSVRQNLSMCTFFPLLNNNKMESLSLLTNRHLKSTTTVVSSSIAPKTEILFWFKWCQVSNQSTH